jgi:hypothetical protein
VIVLVGRQFGTDTIQETLEVYSLFLFSGLSTMITMTKSKYSLFASLLVTSLLLITVNAFAQEEEGRSRSVVTNEVQGQPRDTAEVKPQEDAGLSAGPQAAANLTLAQTTIRTETFILPFNQA